MVQVAGMPFYTAQTSIIPGQDGFAITPSDITNFNVAARAVYVGVAGDISIVTLKDTSLLFKNAVAGSVIPMMALRVNLTNTTATDLIGII